MVHLKPMQQAEYDAYLEQALREYAEEHVKAGNWDPAEAIDLSRKEFAQLLPNGVESPKQHLYSVRDAETDTPVGMIWFAERDDRKPAHAWIYDIRIDDHYQGKGYGKDTMRALEDKVRAVGLDRISLHVFGHNKVARGLYEKIGYEATNLMMTKEL